MLIISPDFLLGSHVPIMFDSVKTGRWHEAMIKTLKTFKRSLRPPSSCRLYEQNNCSNDFCFMLIGISIRKTSISSSETAEVYKMQGSANDILTYTKQGDQYCEVSCSSPVLSDQTSYLEDLPIYLYNISHSNNSFRIVSGHNTSQMISMHGYIPFFSSRINRLFVSPKGYLSTAPSGTTLIGKENMSILAAYITDSTNRFVGDVYVDITTNASMCERVWRDTKAHLPLKNLPPTRLIIITWLGVVNIRDPYERNTFQAVIASNDNKTYVHYKYANLNTTKGFVGYLYNNCNGRYLDKLDTTPGLMLSFSTRTYLLVTDCMKDNEKTSIPPLLRKILLVVGAVFIMFLLLIMTIHCKCRCRSREDFYAERNSSGVNADSRSYMSNEDQHDAQNSSGVYYNSRFEGNNESQNPNEVITDARYHRNIEGQNDTPNSIELFI